MVVLTKRDQKLMALIAHYGMLSTKQIAELLFKNIRKTTLLRRLRLLERRNYIRRSKALPDGGNVWFLTSKAEAGFGFEGTAPSLNRNSIEHDLALIDVRKSLETIGLGDNWISEQRLKRRIYSHRHRNDERLKFVPDAIFSAQIRDHNHAIAVEIETSPKTLARYEKIFRRYSKQQNITFIWYFVVNESFGRGLLQKWNDATRSNEEDHFAFSLISEIVSNPRSARLHFADGKYSVENFFVLPKPAHTYAQGISIQESNAA